PDHVDPPGTPHRRLCMLVSELRVLLDVPASHHQMPADPFCTLLAQGAQPLPGFTVQLGERHAVVDRWIRWTVRLRRAGITARKGAPMLPPTRTPLATAATPGPFTAGTSILDALPLAPRAAIAATTCVTLGPATTVAAPCSPCTTRTPVHAVRPLRELTSQPGSAGGW